MYTYSITHPVVCARGMARQVMSLTWLLVLDGWQIVEGHFLSTRWWNKKTFVYQWSVTIQDPRLI